MTKKKLTSEEREAQLEELRNAARARFLLAKQRQVEVQQQAKNLDIHACLIHVQNNFDDSSGAGFLPSEIMVLIFGYLDIRDLCKSIALICRGWCFLSRFESVWKHLYSKHFPISSFNSDPEVIRAAFSSWFEAFSFRFDLRSKWKQMKTIEVVHLDFYKDELNMRGSKRARYDPFGTNEEKSINRNQISCAALHGERLVTGDHGRVLKLWNIKTQQLSKIIKGHKDFVTCVLMDRTRIISSGAAGDPRIIVWDVKTGTPVGLLRKKEAPPADTTSSSTTTTTTPALPAMLLPPPVPSTVPAPLIAPVIPANPPTGTKFAIIMKQLENTVYIMYNDYSVEIYDLKTLSQKAMIKAPTNVQFTDLPTDRYLDVTKQYLITCIEKIVRVFDLRIPSVCIKTIDIAKMCNIAQPENIVVLGAQIDGTCVALSISYYDDQITKIHFLDIKSGKELAKKRVTLSSTSYATQVCFDDEKIIVTQGHESTIHDRGNGLVMSRVATPANHQIGVQKFDEMRLLTCTTAGGVVIHSFAKSNMYWLELAEGKTLGTNDAPATTTTTTTTSANETVVDAMEE